MKEFDLPAVLAALAARIDPALDWTDVPMLRQLAETLPACAEAARRDVAVVEVNPTVARNLSNWKRAASLRRAEEESSRRKAIRAPIVEAHTRAPVVGSAVPQRPGGARLVTPDPGGSSWME